MSDIQMFCFFLSLGSFLLFVPFLSRSPQALNRISGTLSVLHSLLVRYWVVFCEEGRGAGGMVHNRGQGGGGEDQEERVAQAGVLLLARRV